MIRNIIFNVFRWRPRLLPLARLFSTPHNQDSKNVTGPLNLIAAIRLHVIKNVFKSTRNHENIKLLFIYELMND